MGDLDCSFEPCLRFDAVDGDADDCCSCGWLQHEHDLGATSAAATANPPVTGRVATAA